MISNPMRARVLNRRDQRGAVVVETALVITFFLFPMLLGVLTLGERLWRLQKYDPYEPRIYASQIVGVFTCTDLINRVKTTVANNIAGLGAPVDASWVDAVVIESDPTSVLVAVSVTVPPPGGTGDPVVMDASTRIENVNLSSITCP